MTYDIYRYIFIGAAILCGIMFVVSILLFIFLKIPKVINDLRGVTAQRAIKDIRERNEASGDKGYQVSAFNQQRGKLTDRITPSGNVVEQYRSQTPAVGTTKIATQELIESAGETTMLEDFQTSNETTILGGGQDFNKTESLDNNQALNETELLGNVQTSGQTTILSEEPVDAGETTILSAPTGDSAFSIEYEITYVHTNEVIESGVYA